jgi:hypothetical protein
MLKFRAGSKMTADLDLFQATDPRTRGICGAIEKRRRQAGHFCTLSLMSVDPAQAECGNGWWKARVGNAPN